MPHWIRRHLRLHLDMDMQFEACDAINGPATGTGLPPWIMRRFVQGIRRTGGAADYS